MFLQRIIRAALCLIIMIALGCDHESDTLTEDSDTAGMEPSDDGIDQPLRGEVVINDTGMAAGQWGSDPYMIETGGDDTPVIEGDTLTITVSYGGGCEDHDFTLVASNVFAESYPVQLRGIVAHDAHGDRCRAYLTEDYDFDLAPIKTLYQAAYQQDAGTIVLLLQTVREDLATLIYTFES